MHFERYLDFSKIIITYMYFTVTLFTNVCFHLFFLCKQLLVKFLYGLLYNNVIVLTLASITIFVPLLNQIIHIG